MINTRHGAPANALKILSAGGDGGTITLDDAPIHSVVFEIGEIARRDTFELGATDMGADDIDQGIPAASRLEQCRGGHVRFASGAFIDAPEKFLLRLEKRALTFDWKPER